MTPLSFWVTPEGTLPIGIKESLKRIIPAYAGKKMRLTLQEVKDKRSLSANNYYWVAIVHHVRQVRFDNGDPVSIEQCHEDLLAEFSPRIVRKYISNKGEYLPKRSKEMNVKEFADYITAITAAMAAFGSPVPMREEEYSPVSLADLAERDIPMGKMKENT